MKRSSAIRRAVLAAAAAALAVTGCTAQAVGSDGKPPSPATTSAAPAPSSSAPSAPAPSSSAPSSPAPSARALMKDGDENEQVRELQARLRQLDHFDRAPTGFYGTITAKAVTRFQEMRGLPGTGSVDGTTWERLLSLTKKPTADELKPSTTNELDTPDARCMTGRVLCISKESRTLAWMIDGEVVSSMDVRFGSENTPTREGIFLVDRKVRDDWSKLYHTPMPLSMYFSRGQAVHYSSDFAARGYNGGSHGCVNVRDRAKLSALFDQVKVGDKVVVHW
ncbi:L,D-transpeptidase family protein [Streptomyces sp. NPDC056049]|uniref:L,D-transpeptidase family protein n=1 Tax=Streptomyces sp. NPDC056049 TaxID=3345693 RepID=UPI0035DE4D76